MVGWLAGWLVRFSAVGFFFMEYAATCKFTPHYTSGRLLNEIRPRQTPGAFLKLFF